MLTTWHIDVHTFYRSLLLIISLTLTSLFYSSYFNFYKRLNYLWRLVIF